MNLLSLVKSNKIIRYIFSGGIATVSGLLILYFLTDILDLWYLFSSIISFSLMVIISYSLHKFFTFNDYSRKGISIQFSIFVVYNLSMLLFNSCLMYFFVDILGIWYVFSQIFISLFTALINFIFFSRIVFK